MSRRIRFIPDTGALVEVTDRTLHSRFLLRPGPGLNEIIIGALARAKSLYPVRICAFAFASNHFHLILEVQDARHLAGFMGHFNSKIAREVGRLTGWADKIFARRYQAILISDEPEAQIARLRYVLSHGVKEGLVERLAEWPGVHCVQALTEGKVLEGWWFDRTQEYMARRRGEDFGRFQYASRQTLELDPLPCLKHLTAEQRQKLVAAMATEIEEEAAAHRDRTGAKPLGRAAVLAQNPLSQPVRTKKSSAPAVHAATSTVRRELRDAYFWFVAAYRAAAEKLRAGQRDAPFPLGCFPPPLPFVGG
jgi:hypothetical protein